MGPESQQQITIDRGEQLLSAQQPHCKNLLHLFCSTSRTRDSSGSQLRPSQEALNCMLYNINLWHWTKRFHTDYLTERSQWRDIGAHSTFEKIKTRRGSTMWLGSSKSKAWSQDPCPLTVEWVLNFNKPLNQVHFFLTKNKCQFPWLYPRLRDKGSEREPRHPMFEALQMILMCTKVEDHGWVGKTARWPRPQSLMVPLTVGTGELPGALPQTASFSGSRKSVILNLYHFPFSFSAKCTLIHTVLKSFILCIWGDMKDF